MPVDGRCVNGRCVCPAPWTGGSCQKRLECAYYADHLGWGDTLCRYDYNSSVGGDNFLACVCNVSGSFESLVIEQSQNPTRPKPFLGLRQSILGPTWPIC